MRASTKKGSEGKPRTQAQSCMSSQQQSIVQSSPRFYALKIINKKLIKTNRDIQMAMSERYIL